MNTYIEDSNIKFDDVAQKYRILREFNIDDILDESQEFEHEDFVYRDDFNRIIDNIETDVKEIIKTIEKDCDTRYALELLRILEAKVYY